MEIFEEALSRMMQQVNQKKEEILEDVASAGIDPRLVKFTIDYHTEERDHSCFLNAIISPKFVDSSLIFGDPRR